MKVLILGFDDIEELDRVMMKMIEETQCFLFNVVCGDRECIAEKWAEKRGTGFICIQPKDPSYLSWYCDYVVMKLDASSPQWMKNLLMQFKQCGKHGTVVR